MLYSNTVKQHARRCLGPSPTIVDLCRAGEVEAGDGCWEWRGPRQTGDEPRYGLVSGATRERYDGERYAHRLALILDGRSPGELFALHHCDNPPCIRPDHLYVGTSADNARDVTERGQPRSGIAAWTDEQRARAWAKRAATNPPYVNRACIICGTEFRVRSDRPQRSCSSQCAHVATWQTRHANSSVR